jgi:hypothetical protein
MQRNNDVDFLRAVGTPLPRRSSSTPETISSLSSSPKSPQNRRTVMIRYTLNNPRMAGP